MTGSYPAILGMDLGDRSYKPNITSHWLGRRAYERNEIITLSIHFKNPVTGGSPWIGGDKGDTLKTVKRILPRGDHNSKLNEVLDEVASWAHSFTDSQGKLIPAIFGYLHELNGGWFWWGLNNKAQNTAQELQELYLYTVQYLRDQKGVHNFLYAYSPDKFASKDDYLKTYPGDDVVDIFGMDWYYASPSDLKTTLHRSVKDVVEMAEKRNKVPALTETGYMGDGINKFPNFWQEYILDILKSDPTTKRIAFVHTWSNHCYGNAYCEIWVPYKGHPAESAFVTNFYNDSLTILSNQLPQSIY
ncbi:hypothetical protein SNE40_006164 [Patella caerulea]|uniref:GH26 domain-containing protein n=1 Tax=Patella caerulea TaxID=87958 RepID=A0AAN8K920_PATCE